MQNQLILDFNDLTRLPSQCDIIKGSFNENAIKWLHEWPEWPLPKIVCIYGESGWGKSFLSSFWKRKANAFEITESKILNTNPFEVLKKFSSVFIDHADLIMEESWLYNLFNMCYNDATKSILMTSQKAPKHWNKIPDLTSRLSSTLCIEIHQPDDQSLIKLIKSFFYQRGLEISNHSVQFLVNHVDRDVQKMKAACANIDLFSKKLKKPITVPLIKESFITNF